MPASACLGLPRAAGRRAPGAGPFHAVAVCAGDDSRVTCECLDHFGNGTLFPRSGAAAGPGR